MKQSHLPALAEQLVTIRHDQPVTDTLVIAAKFNKEHKNIIRAVRAVAAECPPEFNRLNFEPVEFIDSKGEKQPMYQLTEKGFALVAMGFTGPKFMEWKIRFLDEFERRGRELLQLERRSRDYALGIILENRPVWTKIKRYKGMGLTHTEVARLLGMGGQTLRRNLREMESLGLIEPTPRLIELQALALRVLHGREAK